MCFTRRLLLFSCVEVISIKTFEVPTRIKNFHDMYNFQNLMCKIFYHNSIDTRYCIISR